jgi:hypothetical protein
MIRFGHHEATRLRRRCWTERDAVLSINPSPKRLHVMVVLHLRPADWGVANRTRRLVSTRGFQSRIRLSTSLRSATTDSQQRGLFPPLETRMSRTPAAAKAGSGQGRLGSSDNDGRRRPPSIFSLEENSLIRTTIGRAQKRGSRRPASAIHRSASWPPTAISSSACSPCRPA